MLFFAVYVVVIAILVLAAYLGAKSGVIQRFLGMYPRVPKLLVMGYIVFAGCVVFPISSEPFPLDFQKGYLLEYGEVSNVYNFTPFNVICYLAVVPTGTLIAYCWIVRKLRRRQAVYSI